MVAHLSLSSKPSFYAGFSEIRSYLRTKTNASKPLQDLQLWFSLDEDVLYAHDLHIHEKCIALAVYNKSDGSWQIVFSGGSYGKQVIKYATNSSKTKNVVKELDTLYKLHGYIGL